MNETALAAVFTEARQPLSYERFSLPALAAGETLVRVTCTTLCGSDVHTFLGHRSTPVPTVLGHEILGVVEQVAADESPCDYDGRPLQPGDRVTWSIAASCDDCFYCHDGIPQKCESLFKYGHERIVPRHPLSGGLAEVCHLAAGTAIFRIPDHLSDAVACPANCATATVAAAMRLAGDCRGRTVLIQGTGMLGLTAAAMASSGGAREVLACDVDQARLDSATQFGATRTLLVGQDQAAVVAEIRAATGGRGVDLAIELSGAASAVEIGLDALRTGGRYVLIGSTRPERPVPLDAESVVRRCLSIVGNHNYRPDDLAAAVKFLTEHANEFPFAELVHDAYHLGEADAAFQRAIAGQELRVAVRPTVRNL